MALFFLPFVQLPEILHDKNIIFICLINQERAFSIFPDFIHPRHIIIVYLRRCFSEIFFRVVLFFQLLLALPLVIYDMVPHNVHVEAIFI
nr:MAG: hypothetical protein [Bacteriophage sp.]